MESGSDDDRHDGNFVLGWLNFKTFLSLSLSLLLEMSFSYFFSSLSHSHGMIVLHNSTGA